MTLVRRVALMVVPFVLGIAAPAHGMWNCSTGSAVTDPASNPDLVADCEVLLAANREWGGTLNWSAQRPISEWKGVTVSGTPSRVTKLILNDSELSGSIPAELGNLSNLAQLDLYRNDLSGSIPRALGSLSNLTILRLYSNELTGSIPRELGNLSNLNYLNLSYNQLTGYIPWELRRLTNLTRFGVHYNSLQGSIPYWIGNLTNLTLLYLGRSGLSGSMPSWLGNLTRLQHLYLAALGLTGRVPSELGSLTNLSHLWLNGNDLSGCVPLSMAVCCPTTSATWSSAMSRGSRSPRSSPIRAGVRCRWVGARRPTRGRGSAATISSTVGRAAVAAIPSGVTVGRHDRPPSRDSPPLRVTRCGYGPGTRTAPAHGRI